MGAFYIRRLCVKFFMKKKKFLSLLLFSILILFVFFPVYYLNQNIERQNISTGFHFLTQEAGFEISETLITYNSYLPYSKALITGLVNTIYVAIIGNIFALILGILLGVFSLSSNFLLSKFCFLYLNFFRNIPLLLQLFFWYGIFTDVLPSVKRATPFLGIVASNRGIAFPWFNSSWAIFFIVLILIICAVFIFLLNSWAKKIFKSNKKMFLCMAFIAFLIIQFNMLIRFFPLDYPIVSGFNVRGGLNFTPEFLSLLLGLVLYTGAFLGEIVRSGILAVDKGQWEAAYALGLTKIQTLQKIILPQSFKVALPPMTAQFLNLTKNSSLAVAIGYPDFVSVANTTMNQTGQAVELVLMIMGLFLFTSLSVSSVANLINRKLLGVNRR